MLLKFSRVTVITALQLLRCYGYYGVTVITALRLLRRYGYYGVAVITLIKLVSASRACE